MSYEAPSASHSIDVSRARAGRAARRLAEAGDLLIDLAYAYAALAAVGFVAALWATMNDAASDDRVAIGIAFAVGFTLVVLPSILVVFVIARGASAFGSYLAHRVEVEWSEVDD
jgi:hypothetical protein